MDRTIQKTLFISWSHRLRTLWISVMCLTVLSPAFADTTDATLAVWANEAIVSAYTFNETNLLQRQKDIAQYFTAQGWINFTKAMATNSTSGRLRTPSS